MTESLKNFFKNRFKDAEGKSANPGNIADLKVFARDLGNFIFSLRKVDQNGAASPSFSNNFAGSDLNFFAAEWENQLKTYKQLVPGDFLQEKFEKAALHPWTKNAVWLHGQLTPANLLVDESGKLVNVQNWDKAVIGDPACDLTIAWSLFDSKVRKIFFGASGASVEEIDRARILALISALRKYNSQDIDEQIFARDALSEILEDYGYSADQDNLFDPQADRQIDSQPIGM